MEKKKNVRSSNFELLRIVAMYMIIIYHIVRHCVRVQLRNPEKLGRLPNLFFNQPIFFKRVLMLNIFMTFGLVGNAIFILISGYFLAGKTEPLLSQNDKPANGKSGMTRLGRISVKLLLQLGFAAVLLVLVPTICHFLRPDIFISMYNITKFNQMSWFVGYYFIVVACGILFLNRFLARLDQRLTAAFLLALLAFLSFDFSGILLDSLAEGLRTIVTGIFLYSLGGFIRKYDPFRNVRIYFFFLIIVAVYLLLLISGYNVTETNIETYFRSASIEPFIQWIPDNDNFSIVTIIVGVCLFEIFRRIHLPGSRVITFLGKATFMVYLLHDNKCFYELWNLRDWALTLQMSPASFILNLLKWAGYTFIAGIAAYILYELVLLAVKHMKWLVVRKA